MKHPAGPKPPTPPAPAAGAKTISGRIALNATARPANAPGGPASGAVVTLPPGGGHIDLFRSFQTRLDQARQLIETQAFGPAERLLAELIAEQPRAHTAQHLRATLLFQTHRWSEAEALWRELRQTRPDDPHMANGHAAAMGRCGRHPEARELLETVLARSPDFLAARLNLASLLRQNLSLPAQALAVLAPALPAHARDTALQFAIGRTRQDLLDAEGADRAYREALALDPMHLKALSAWLFNAHCLSAPDLAALRAQSESHGQRLHEARGRPPRPAAPPLGERLRIGLVSGDLNDHPVAYFLESVLRAWQQRPVDVFVYANSDKTDPVEQRLRACVGHWRPVAALTDTQLARLIGADRLNVLLDLSGYTNHHRLGVFMQRPAPLQLSWLGYFGTLGLPAIDGVIADPHCVPPDEQRFFSERLLHMPHTRLCMSAPANAPDIASEPPLASGRGLRFASFQNLQKLNPRVLAAWRRILDGAPDASLLLQSRQMARPEIRAAFEKKLDASGIDRSRVHLRAPSQRSAYLAQYNEVDVLLDSFPYPGGTSTAEALWMGVPTLALATPGMLGRQGQAMLELVGLGDWVAHSDDLYIEKAIALARNLDDTLARLRHLRQTLRETARQSPLFDADSFARDFEALLRRACAEGAEDAANPPTATTMPVAPDPALADKVQRVAHFNALLAQGDLDGADAALRALLNIDATAAPLQRALAALRQQQANRVQLAAIQEQVRQATDDPQRRLALAQAMSRLGEHASAKDLLTQTIERWPERWDARLQLATTLRVHLRQPRTALSVLAATPPAHARQPELHFETGCAWLDLLDTDQALAAFQHILTLAPDSLTGYSIHAFATHYRNAPDLAALRQWLEHHGAALPAPPPAPRAAPRKGARLRIGLLSGDFKDHPVSYFLETVLAALKRRGVDAVAYATASVDDDTTARLRQGTITWREVANLSDTALARQIADDRLDVLLDLAGFTHHHRLGALLQRPATLQIGWLGYFGTLGGRALDAVIADPHCVPPDEQRFFSERLLYLPNTRLCMSPPADAPEPAPEPPLARAPGLRLTCVQNLKKINPRVLAAWRRILDGAPQARLLIQASQVAQPEVRDAFEARLAASGIDRARVDLAPPSPRRLYLAGFDAIDLLLDTFPYPGGTTTAEALWMGVPTLTLASPGMLGRQGQALLHQVGLDDFVTHSDDAYVQRAIALAQDRDGTLATLRRLRQTLRETARQSPLFDADSFARDFETLLRRACADGAAPAKEEPPR